MLHAIIIGAVLALLVSEPMWAGRSLPLDPLPALALTLAATFGVWIAAAALTLAAARRLDRGRPLRWARIAEMALIAGRLGVGAVQIAALLTLGLLPAVRAVIGNWPALDELVALLPLYLGLALMALASYPLERRFREATLLRRIDEGAELARLHGPLGHTLSVLRNQMALILVPLTALLIWHDTIVWTEMQAGGWLVDRLGLRGAGVALTGAEIAGAAALFLLLPALMRRVWETVPLGPGKLRDDLLDMCARNRVRIREILVWRTDGMMANAAVMGLARPLRYILITDGLLERLPREQVDAVMAHEIAHIRRCHLPWLAVAVIGALLAIALALRPLDPALARLGGAGEAIEGALLLLGAGLVFGLVSRRFEWQADAFAAADRSIAETDPDGPATVTPAAVHAMSGALLAVAVLNHVAPARFSFRHGSIRSRRRRLGRLVGRRVDRLGIDRQVRIIKMLSMLGLAIAVAGWILVS